MCNSVKKMMQQQALVVQNGPLTIGDCLPEFNKMAVLNSENGIEITEITHLYAQDKGQWMILFWWPKDFTFVCPTEIVAFDALSAVCAAKNTVIMGASTDSEYVHLAWREQHPELKSLQIPLLADTSKSLAEAMGVLEAKEKVARRATFIIDPKGTIQWLSIYPMEVGRSAEEVLRVLDALQTEELTACGWTSGQKTLTAQLKEQHAG